MTWNGLEPFDNDTGQFHSPAPSFLPSSVTNGTLSFSGGRGIAAFPDNGQYSAQCFYISGAGDPDDNSYVAIDIIGFTAPGGQAFDVVDVALINNGSNGVFFDALAVITSVRVGANFAGTRMYGSQPSVTTASLPYSIALAWQGNVFSAWVLYAGTGWTHIGAADVNWGAQHDFTAVGGRSGWRPGFIPACQPNQASFTVDNLRWGPISDLTNNYQYLPPTNLQAIFATSSEIQIEWTASAAFVGSGLPPPTYYVVYRNGVQIGTTNSGSTTFVDLGGPFLGSTAYVYTVAAAANSSPGTPISAQSAPLSVTIGPITLQVPFISASVFKPTMLANVAGIKPRVYVPIQNIKVSTKQ